MNSSNAVITDKALPQFEGSCLASSINDESAINGAGLPLRLQGVAGVVLEGCFPGESLTELVPGAATSFGEQLTSGLYDNPPGSPEWSRVIADMRSFLELAEYVGAT